MSNQVESDRFLRLNQIIGNKAARFTGSDESVPIIPVSRSAWYAGIADGIYPPQIKLSGGRTSVWRESDVMAVVAGTYGKTDGEVAIA